MSLTDRVREQLLAIGIDDSGPAPPEEVLPESNDISWSTQRDYLLTVITETEGVALYNLLHHPLIATLDHEEKEDASRKMRISQVMLEEPILRKWPRT